MYYCIVAQIERTNDGWTRSTQVPTFYLHAAVQGIVDANHACRIAADVVGAGMAEPGILHVSAANTTTDAHASLTLPIEGSRPGEPQEAA